MNMKKTIAILLVLAVVLTGAFAVNVQLKGTVAEGSGVNPGTGGNANPVGVSVWGLIGSTLTDVSSAVDTEVIANAKINSQDQTENLVTSYTLGAYYAGNYNTAFSSTVTITPAGFKLSGTGDVVVGVTATPSLVTDPSGKVVGSEPVTGAENSASTAKVAIAANTLVASKTQFAQFALSWTPVATAVAGNYTCDVTIGIASNR
jgi:hypothetical protein